MITTYIRSSSYNNFDFCQMQYYLTYVLGLERVAGKKADKGTIVHKVLESLALMKKSHQDNGVYEVNDDVVGSLRCSDDDFMKPRLLKSTEIADINASRINKWVYITKAKLDRGHVRYGVPLVEELISRAFNFYKEKSEEKWSTSDFTDCTNFVWMALDYRDGMFDPRKRKIVQAEPYFDILIEKDWAKYDWTLGDGKNIQGYLAIKGTVDLITQVDNGIFEVIDWKTGQAKNWATGNRKEYVDICKDTQLMLYYYAIRRLYPDIKDIIVSIFFIRDGGPYTVSFDDSTLVELEDRLRKRFEEIKQCNLPIMTDPTQKDFKCKICDYSKGSNICRIVHDKIREVGIDQTTKQYINPNFKIGTYDAPGE